MFPNQSLTALPFLFGVEVRFSLWEEAPSRMVSSDGSEEDFMGIAFPGHAGNLIGDCLTAK
jgi:hypothetical protein